MVQQQASNNMAYGFQKTSGTQRGLTLGDKLQQIVNLGQPQTFNGRTWTVEMASNGLRHYSKEILNTELIMLLTFKTDKGVYKNFHKTFKDERHFENFVDKMCREYGWKFITAL